MKSSLIFKSVNILLRPKILRTAVLYIHFGIYVMLRLFFCLLHFYLDCGYLVGTMTVDVSLYPKHQVQNLRHSRCLRNICYQSSRSMWYNPFPKELKISLKSWEMHPKIGKLYILFFIKVPDEL